MAGPVAGDEEAGRVVDARDCGAAAVALAAVRVVLVGPGWSWWSGVVLVVRDRYPLERLVMAGDRGVVPSARPGGRGPAGNALYSRMLFRPRNHRPITTSWRTKPP